jgi:small neutral amino acid transporter SnatA (MarC family)
MVEDYEKSRRRQVIRMRSIMDYVMGFLFFLIGLYFLTYQKLGINVFRKQPSPADYFIGALFVLYGIWRMYRGYKKNYFVE